MIKRKWKPVSRLGSRENKAIVSRFALGNLPSQLHQAGLADPVASFAATPVSVLLVSGGRALQNHVDWLWLWLCDGRFSSKIESSTIQVSLVPPPWLELTTSDFSFKATLVNPPGTTRMPFAPVRTKGRKSTCRDAMPASKKVGVVESASVG